MSLITAIQFGTSLDKDDFNTTLDLLELNCLYDIGNEVISGAKNIIDSYEQNMLAGRKKMDRLEWGQSRINAISENEFIVNFTDYLYHKGEKYTHHCQQKLFTNEHGKICKIVHIQDDAEQKRLYNWYHSVGIPTS